MNPQSPPPHPPFNDWPDNKTTAPLWLPIIGQVQVLAHIILKVCSFTQDTKLNPEGNRAIFTNHLFPTVRKWQDISNSFNISLIITILIL